MKTTVKYIMKILVNFFTYGLKDMQYIQSLFTIKQWLMSTGISTKCPNKNLNTLICSNYFPITKQQGPEGDNIAYTHAIHQR